MVRLFGAVTTFVCAFGLVSGAVANDRIETVEAVAAQTVSADIVETGVERVMNQLPQMTYMVGEVETKCGYSAASQAKSSGKPVSYLVAGSSYNCKVTAMNKLAEAMKAELAKTASVSPSVAGSCYHCPMAAAAMAKQKNTEVRYMVAGVEFECEKKAQSVADRLAAKMKECGAATASSKPCSKSAAIASSKPCSKAAGSSPCSKSAAKVASARADGKGCCKTGCAKAAAGGAPCAKSAEAAVASAKGGCSKSKDAQTASAKGSGCSKSKAAAAQTASAKSSGCSKGKTNGDAVVAAAKSTETSTLKLGCCKKGKAPEAAAQVASKDAEATSEDTPELARAKQMVREIVEFVATAKNS